MRSVSTRPPTAAIEDEYGLSEGAFHMAPGELRLSNPQADVFGSTALRKCARVWTKEDNDGSPVGAASTGICCTSMPHGARWSASWRKLRMTAPGLL